MPSRGNWYCRVIGVELGPMTWDDLLGMADRTNLGRIDLVRQGEDGAWVAADSIAGLFSERLDQELEFELGPSLLGGPTMT